MIPKAQRVRLLRFLTALGLLLGVLIICAMVFAPTVSIRINAVEARHDDGFAYIVPFRRQANFLFHHQPDGIDGSSASQLILFEGEKLLGPAHSSHADVRHLGAGRLSHWGTALWFSSSDGTDPRTNGRHYVAEGKLSVRPVWTLAGTVMFGAALLSIAVQALRGLNSRHWRPYVTALNSFAVFLSRPHHDTTLATVLVSLLGVVVCVAAVIYGWYDGDTPTSGLSVVRFFPVSDAFGYHSCATSLSAAGKFDEPFHLWCARRALYPAMLASLLSFTAWSSQLALIAQGALVGLAIAAFALAVSSVAGLLAALVTTVVLSFFAWEFVLGLFMTEVLGFTLGLCGLTLLLGFCKSKNLWHLLAGSILISIGLTARAGALFVLPALPLWAFLAFRTTNGIERMRFFFAALLGVLSGPILQFTTLSLIGADASNTGGNFSVSLYGLSTGSRDWSQAYRDFEPLFQRGESQAFHEIYGIAWENIKGRPEVFVDALTAAGRLYVSTLFSFITGYKLNELLTALAMIGIVRCLLDLKSSRARLIIALALAEVISAPLIIDAGGTRVFAVTAPLRVLLCAIGTQWILLGLKRAFARENELANPSSESNASLLSATGIGVLVVALIVAPVTPLAGIGRLDRVTGLGCPNGLKEVVARLGQESQSFAVVDANELIVSLDPFRVSPQRILDDSRIAATWFGKDLLSLSPPISIVRAVDLSSATASAIKPLAFVGQLPEHDGVKSLCVDESVYLEIAQVRHYFIKQIRPIGERRTH